MKKRHLLLQGNILPATLFATAFVGFITIISLIVMPLMSNTLADMHLEPTQRTLAIGDIFTVSVVVTSAVPVNVFAGELFFDNKILEVQSIDYNTSIADLWAEEPWYSNGEGTLNFAGGTTKQGGFMGSGNLVTVTFKTLEKGSGALLISDAKILKHDGLGTDVPLQKPIDALFVVTPLSTSTVTNLIANPPRGSEYSVIPSLPSPDLNGDGKQSIADISILLLNMGTKDPRFDLNVDGTIDLKDFNIVLTAQ